METGSSFVQARWIIALAMISLGALAAQPAAFAAPPANDNFVNRIALTGSPVVTSASNVEATRESFEPIDSIHTVWWSWIAPSNGLARVAVSGKLVNGGSFYSQLGVYNGNSIDALTTVAVGTDTELAFPTVAGAVYQICVGNTDSLGTVTLSIALGATTVTSPVVVGTPAAANDFFANRTVLSGPVVSGIGYNYDATRESFERDDSLRTL